MNANKQYQEIDLKPYRPWGIAMLKLLFGVMVVSLTITAAYEFII